MRHILFNLPSWELTCPIFKALLSRWFSELPQVGYVNQPGGYCTKSHHGTNLPRATYLPPPQKRGFNKALLRENQWLTKGLLQHLTLQHREDLILWFKKTWISSSLTVESDLLYSSFHYHGSVEKGCISNISILTFFGFFSSSFPLNHDYGSTGWVLLTESLQELQKLRQKSFRRKCPPPKS